MRKLTIINNDGDAIDELFVIDRRKMKHPNVLVEVAERCLGCSCQWCKIILYPKQVIRLRDWLNKWIEEN